MITILKVKKSIIITLNVKMPSIKNKIVIERPIEKVFDLATTTKHRPTWHTQCLKVKGSTENPIQLNEKASEIVNLLGKKKRVEWTCVFYERPTKLILESKSSQISSTIEYTFIKENGAIEFTRFLEYQFQPLLKILELITFRAMRKHQEKSMNQMKEFLFENIPESS